VSAESSSGTIVISGTKGEVFVETHGAAVEVSDVVGRGEFEAVGGRMVLQRIEGSATVASLSGPLSISEVRGALEVEHIDGRTTIERADLSAFEFITVSGDLEFSGTLSAQGVHSIEATRGTISLHFPEGFAATLEIDTFSGQFHPQDFPVTLMPGGRGGGRGRVQRQQFTINGGGTRISIETNSGDVYLRKIGAPARRERDR
jgi:hypothetical protein